MNENDALNKVMEDKQADISSSKKTILSFLKDFIKAVLKLILLLFVIGVFSYIIGSFFGGVAYIAALWSFTSLAIGFSLVRYVVRSIRKKRGSWFTGDFSIYLVIKKSIHASFLYALTVIGLLQLSMGIPLLIDIFTSKGHLFSSQYIFNPNSSLSGFFYSILVFFFISILYQIINRDKFNKLSDLRN